LQASPMAGMKRQDIAQLPRERVLSLDELAEIWQASYDVGYPFGNIVRLLILTGQRLREISGLQRPWVYDQRIEIPAVLIVTEN